MRNRVKVAIAGVGNCASALIQGTIFYIHKNQTEIRDNNTMIDGLLSYYLGGIEPGDFES
jgi:myo-inositol-1-phosphate synthase